VAGAPHEFDDAFDDDESSPLLPPEDRVWRHPSELSAMREDVEAREARDRWLASTPTRAGAWSAGLVGAVLATGVVLVGTHVSSWLGGASSRPIVTTAAVTTTMAPQETSGVLPPLAEKICSAVHSSLAVVTVKTPHGTATGDGVVIASNGMILVPLSLVAGAMAIQVTTDVDSVPYAARVVGSDVGTDLAVVSIGSDWLTPLSAAPDSAVSPDEWLAVEWSLPPDVKSWLSIGTVSSPAATAAQPGSVALLDGLRLQAVGLSKSPVGTVLLNAKGQLLGMIVSRDGDEVVETPGSLAERVGKQILHYGHVVHGWLGIDGESTEAGSFAPLHLHGSEPALPAGVKVVAVGTGTSAAAAGLRAGDVIEAVNGQAVGSIQALQADLYTMPPKAAVTLTVDRGTSLRIVDARLQAAA
jgi:putative serine protease PepD